MSESDRAAAEAAEGALELTPVSGPSDPTQTSNTPLSKESRRVSSSSERQFKVERAQKCLENAALVSKRIKEHRRAAAELLGKAFEDDETCDAASDLASVSTRTSYSVATSDAGPPMSVEDALNIPGISESLANTLKQKELLMERIKQYKERSKRERPVGRSSRPAVSSRLPVGVDEDTTQIRKFTDKLEPAQLQNIIKEKETALSIMQVKMRAMETTILDLQEKISEKDSLIEAKNRATSLMSDNLSKKENDSVNLLEDTRQQIEKMQQNFAAMESEWKEEKKTLLREIESKNERINHLEEANTILENGRFEISLAHSKLAEEIDTKNKIIFDLEHQLINLSKQNQEEPLIFEEEKGSLEISNMVEMTKRLELLEQLNCQIRQTNLELQDKLATLSPQAKSSETATTKKSSPQVTRKHGKSASRNTSAKQKSPWISLAESATQDADKSQTKADTVNEKNSKLDMIIQSLNKEILDKEFEISQKDTIIQNQLEIIKLKEEEFKSHISNKPETVDIGLMCNLEYAKPQEVFTDTGTKQDVKTNKEESVQTTEQLLDMLNVMRDQISSLNLELESANKNMVKVKSIHKLKVKQMQKTIDNFSKMSDSNAEVSKLSEEVNQLTQKIAELEEDKGNLQLHLVDYDSGRLSESDLHRKLIELEALSEARLKAISDLETQKFDLVQELHILQQKNLEMEDKLADLHQLQSEHVCTEMKSLQLEEQLDQAAAARKESQLVIQNLKLDKEHAKQCIKDLQDKSLELSNKLESYIQENMELTDRLEKLSAEKVSSAESIEMVESLTTQEKLELDEYNKKMQFSDQNVAKGNEKNLSAEDEEKAAFNDSLVKLSQESAELNKKIELFTQERHEVMEKMTEIKLENEELHHKIDTLSVEKSNFERQLEVMQLERDQIRKLNTELSTQIEKLKIEQMEVLRETSNLAKRPPSEETSVESESSSKDVLDNVMGDTTGQDDKPQASKTKPSKQLTKEILKLKNIIKEREAEIADCQMKILSLEEQNQKQIEMLKTSTVAENTIKALIEENNQLKEELSILKLQSENLPSIQTYISEVEALKQNNEVLQNTVSSTQCEYLSLISVRDTKINELENLLFDYEGKIKIYNDSLQQKDKDITEYLNQISQLNNVSQKLKSTIEVLEEEKQKDQNGELIKNLNIQIINFQNLISELETKMKIFEEEKNNLMLIKADLSEKNTALESEINTIYNSLLEKEKCLKELHDIKNKHDEEFRRMNNQCKEKDEEIHEIKLQLRKESIENENLRQTLNELDALKSQNIVEIESLKECNNEYSKKNAELTENCHVFEAKNRELMEKLKKFAANLKKKTNMCAEFESQITKLHSEIEQKQNEIEKVYTKVEENAALLTQVTSLSKEIERMNTEGLTLKESKRHELESQVTLLLQEKANMLEKNKNLENSSTAVKQELEALVIKNTSLVNEIQSQNKNVLQLKSDIEILNKKLAEYDVEHKNNLTLNTKVLELESEVCEKQIQISNLLNEIETIQEEFNTFKFGHDAKIQERDLFIENLETEISNYRARISRLEETICIMEDRRYTLERKADQLGCQLEEKQKAYSAYSNDEDELVNRLAVLMDHDQVVEKQLKEIENENSELQNKIQKLLEVNRGLQTNLQSSQEEYLILKNNSNKTHQEELDSAHHRIAHLESQIKKITCDSLAITKKAQNDINILETEFNLQLENNLKEKKILTEKCEKLLEQNSQMEHEIKQHIKSEQALTLNIDELNKLNTDLQDVALKYEETHKNDYTDQYINEINNLQAIINRNNIDVDTLNMQLIESKHTITTLEAKLVTFNEEIVHKEQEIVLLKKQLEHSKTEIDFSQITIEQLKSTIKELENKLSEKDSVVSNTINITSNVEGGGPVKSSTTKDLVQAFDMGSFESQIVLGDEQVLSDQRSENMIRAFEHDTQKTKKEPQEKSSSPQVVEEIIVPKKAYLCYDETTKMQLEQSEVCPEIENDPFNSDDGWGLKEKSGATQKDQYYTNIIADMDKVSQENERLKIEIGNSNTKLAKALKKLKELKTNNDRLMNDLKTANQMSQLNLLDTTIEGELNNQIKDLEEKIAVISADLIKEKREKNILAKQNELFNNANDRFMEMKEKLENEVVMWKYKFKEATDKVLSFEWGEDLEGRSKEPLETKHTECRIAKCADKALLEQTEKENEDLNLLIDQLRKHNSEQTSLQSRQMDEIRSLTNEVSKLKSKIEKEQNDFVVENTGLKSVIANLESNLKSTITKNEENLSCEKCNEREKSLEAINKKLETLHSENNSLSTAIKHLQANIESLTLECNNYRESNNSLNAEIELLQKKINMVHDDLKHSPGTSEAEYVTVAERSKFLEHHCETLKQDIENALKQINDLQSELSASNEKIIDHENKARDFEIITSKLNEENDNLLSTVAELRASISSAVDQRGYEVAEMWKQHLAQRESDFVNIEHELRGQISALENKYEHLLDNVQSSSQEETSKMVMMEQFSSLQTKLKDKEDHFISLQSKYSDLMNEMEMVRAEIEDEKVIHENKLLNQQEESEKQLAELRDQYKNDIMTKDTAISELNKELQNERESNKYSLLKLEENVQTSELLQNDISDLANQIRLKDNEIYEKTQEYNIILNQRNDEFENLRQQLVEFEKKIEEVSFEKESELAVLRLKMHDQLASFEKNQSKLQTDNFELEQQLTQKIEECVNLNKKIIQLNKTLEEDSLKMSEMRAALETQEMEIVTLKDEIEQMQILLETSAANVAKHVTFAPDTKPAADSDAGDESESGDAAAMDAVPRAELDLALYMLHQRDMRCEELTMELTSLLEERDTLQLRLSDCLRLYEELRHKCESAGMETAVESQSSSEKEQGTMEIPAPSTSRGSVSETENLQTKLSELRSVRQMRDVRLRHDSERRDLDMQLLQRDVARLPPAAADHLRQAHYTLTRDSQSASTVLLNWLRGKSTPKVVHM